jgi:hypothetical protein
VHVFLFGLVLLFTPPRIGYHLIDESRGSVNGEWEECPSSSGINVLLLIWVLTHHRSSRARANLPSHGGGMLECVIAASPMLQEWFLSILARNW